MKVFVTPAIVVVAALLVACGGGAASDGGAGSSELSVNAEDLFFDPTELSASAGEVMFELVNVGSADHNITIDAVGEDPIVEAAGGETATGTAQLDAGSYDFYCSVPGHKEAGMVGTLTVS